MNGSAYAKRTECPVPSRQQCETALTETSVRIQHDRWLRVAGIQERGDEDGDERGAA